MSANLQTTYCIKCDKITFHVHYRCYICHNHLHKNASLDSDKNEVPKELEEKIKSIERPVVLTAVDYCDSILNNIFDLKDTTEIKEKISLISNLIKSIDNKEEVEFEDYEKLTFVQKIKSFILLDENWDSYGAGIIEQEIIDRAVNFLKLHIKYSPYLAFVYPGINKSIGLEYKNNNKRIGFNIYKDTIELYSFNNSPITTESPEVFFKVLET
jgi:hypothetical protein